MSDQDELSEMSDERSVPPDTSFEASELEAIVCEALGVAEVRAFYSTGESVGRQVRTPWWISVAIINAPELNDAAAFDAAARRVSELAAGWLRETGRDEPGTLLDTSLHELHRLGPLSISNGLRGSHMWLGDGGELLPDRPAWLSEFEFEDCC